MTNTHSYRYNVKPSADEEGYFICLIYETDIDTGIETVYDVSVSKSDTDLDCWAKDQMYFLTC